MLINLSNHPFEDWDEKQKQAAMSAYGVVEDLPFPEVDPAAHTQVVAKLAADYLNTCIIKFGNTFCDTDSIHISGEPCFLFHFVTIAKAKGINCICSTTKRMVSNQGNTKTMVFNFVNFRNY